MKLIESQLRRIIREEVSSLNEMFFSSEYNRDDYQPNVFYFGDFTGGISPIEAVADKISKNPRRFSSLLKILNVNSRADRDSIFNELTDALLNMKEKGESIEDFLNSNLSSSNIRELRKAINSY